MRAAAGGIGLFALVALGVGLGMHELRRPATQTPQNGSVSQTAGVVEPLPVTQIPPAPPTGFQLTGSKLAPTTQASSRKPPLTAFTKTTTTRTAPFVPTRVFGWAKQSRADAYVIRFFRNGYLVLQGRTSDLRYVLPAGFTFIAGTYYWEVVPVIHAKQGPAIVTSRFVVS